MTDVINIGDRYVDPTDFNRDANGNPYVYTLACEVEGIGTWTRPPGVNAKLDGRKVSTINFPIKLAEQRWKPYVEPPVQTKHYFELVTELRYPKHGDDYIARDDQVRTASYDYYGNQYPVIVSTRKIDALPVLPKQPIYEFRFPCEGELFLDDATGTLVTASHNWRITRMKVLVKP